MDFRNILCLILILLAAGCATQPPSAHGPRFAALRSDDPSYPIRYRILSAAEELLGTPYVLGGTSRAGIDCSGLVHYAYLQAGIDVPRTTAQLYRFGKHQDFIMPGDLLFFKTAPPWVSHVGIYVGDGQMIHASSGSRRVSKVSLSRPYWRQRLAGGATFLVASQ